MKPRFHAILVLLASLMVAALPAGATAPSTMSYQGVLTDNGGHVVGDGFYSFTFRIYDVGSGGVPLWVENQGSVAVSKGGFAVILGAVTPITVAFDRQLYLGIAVNGGAELVPRVALAGAPHALGLRLPFAGAESSSEPLLSIQNSGGGPAIVANPLIEVGTPGATGIARCFRNGSYSATVEASGSGFSNGGQLVLRDDVGNDMIQLYRAGSGQGGISVASDPFFSRGMAMRSKFDASGDPEFLMLGGASMVYFDGSQTGDAAVQLPAASVSAPEQLDEPGIAQGHENVAFLAGTISSTTNIVSVTITTPASGYIVVEAEGTHIAVPSNGAYLQISEVSTGPMINNYSESRIAGDQRSPVSERAAFFKPAGTYTFYFQGWAYPAPSSPSDNFMWQPTITAQYFPTSYGSVWTAASMEEARPFAHVQSQPLPANLTQPIKDGVLVDLRDLELRESRQAAALEKTRREIAEMRLRAVPAAAPAKH